MNFLTGFLSRFFAVPTFFFLASSTDLTVRAITSGKDYKITKWSNSAAGRAGPPPIIPQNLNTQHPVKFNGHNKLALHWSNVQNIWTLNEISLLKIFHCWKVLYFVNRYYCQFLLELETKVKRRFAKIVQSRRRPLLGPSPSWKRLMIIALASQFHIYLLWGQCPFSMHSV